MVLNLTLRNLMPDKLYESTDGFKCTLDQMVKIEPEWAANRIREGEKAAVQVKQLEAQIYELEKPEKVKTINDFVYVRKDVIFGILNGIEKEEK